MPERAPWNQLTCQDWESLCQKLACSKLSDSRETRKKKARGKLAGRVSFLPFYFRVCAFSIQRTRLSRSLEQASQKWENEQTCPNHTNEWLSTLRKLIFVILESIIYSAFIPQVSMVYFNMLGKHALIYSFSVAWTSASLGR